MGKMTEKDLLIVEPAEELVLKGPFNRAVCKKLSFINPSKDRQVTFKIKTTSPGIFSVRPNVGIVDPEQTVDIDIFVHPLLQECITQRRHKFLIQAAEAGKNVSDVQEFWKSVSLTSIWETKIKVKLIASDADAEQKVLADVSCQKESSVEPLEEEPSDPLAKLLKQVNTLEEERSELLIKVQELTRESGAKIPKKQGREKLAWIFAIFVILIAICAVFLGKN